MSDRLTIPLTLQEVEHLAHGIGPTTLEILAKQLLATMRREFRLKETMIHISEESSDETIGINADEVLKELYPSEYSGVEVNDAKPKA